MADEVERTGRARELFDRLIELTPERRRAELDGNAVADPTLIAELRLLLDAAENSWAQALSQPGVGRLGALEDARPLEAGAVVGSYRVVRALGEGTFGVVYLAEQASPKRDVALKVFKPYLEPAILRRFEQEALALARLQHPGIARVYESGTAEVAGVRRLYLAMEFVEGLPLTGRDPARPGHAERADLDLNERIRLLAGVCDAVHYAHQQGVIHRDLKPANILVDGRGQPRVIDFGVARLTGAEGVATLETIPGQIMGTLSYMSPEQASGNPAEVDVRTDVYALGVMLFELLARALPVDLSGRPLPEAIRILHDAEAPALGRLDRRLRGDIETIVAKAMAKDKAARYQSAAALGEDLGRFLANQPITARAPSAMYLFRKVAARNRLATAAAAVAALAMVAAVAGTTAGFIKARETAGELRVQLTKTYVATAEQARSRGDWPLVLQSAQAAAGSAGAATVDNRLMQLEAFDAMDRFADAEAMLKELVTTNANGARQASILLWQADLNLLRLSAGAPGDVPAALRTVLESPKGDLSDAERALAAGLNATSWDDCVSHLEEAARLDPYSHRINMNLVEVCLAAGRLDQALERSKVLVMVSPGSQQAWLLRATTLALAGQGDETGRALESAAHLGDSAQSLAIGKVVRFMLKWTDRAVWRDAMLGRRDALPSTGLVTVLLDIMSSMAAIDEPPRVAPIVRGMFSSVEAALPHLLSGNVRGIIGATAEGVGPGYRPTLDYAWANYALQDGKDTEEALRRLETVAAGPPGVFDTRTASLFLLSREYFKQWEKETDPVKQELHRNRCLSAIERVVPLWPPDAEQTLWLCLWSGKLKDFSLARVFFVMARGCAPDSQIIRQVDTWLLFEQEAYGPAATACREYLQRWPDDEQIAARLQASLDHLPPEERGEKPGDS